MSDYKVITLTGTDRSGKRTQSILLNRALQPSKRMESPDYGHWSGQIIRAALHGEPFSLCRGDAYTGAYAGEFAPDADPYIFQMLQSINRRSRHQQILEGLKRHHWVMDRYDLDALAYGLVDGCDKTWLRDTHRALYCTSDYCVVLLGPPIARPGEVADSREQNEKYQDEVANVYCQLSEEHPEWVSIVQTEPYLREPKEESILRLHAHICSIVSIRLGLEIKPITSGLVFDQNGALTEL